MGKQRRHQKIQTERPESVNAVNWQRVAVDLYRAGKISREALGVDPDYRPPTDPNFNPSTTQ